MTIGICPHPSGPTPVAREMRRVSDSIKMGYWRMRNYSPPSLKSCKARCWVPWDVDSPNSHGQVLTKLLANLSSIAIPPTFFARFVRCKLLLSNFYKHDFFFRGKCLDSIYRAYQYHQAILLKKDKVAKSIMKSSAYHTAKQQLSRIQCKKAPNIDIVIKLMHELIQEKYKQVNDIS